MFLSTIVFLFPGMEYLSIPLSGLINQLMMVSVLHNITFLMIEEMVNIF